MIEFYLIWTQYVVSIFGHCSNLICGFCPLIRKGGWGAVMIYLNLSFYQNQVQTLWRIVHFYRTQVNLGFDLWVRVSLTHSLTHSKRLCRLN